jgi:hypothetical protein
MYLGSFRELTDARPADVAVVDGNGDQLTGFDSSRPANATITSVPSSITSVVLLPANPARRYFFIHNAGSKILHVAFAATATAALFTVVIAANTDYEAPVNGYTGVVSGIWNAVSGNAIVTEVTT